MESAEGQEVDFGLECQTALGSWFLSLQVQKKETGVGLVFLKAQKSQTAIHWRTRRNHLI